MKTFSSKHWHTCTYLKHVTTSEVTMADNIALSIAITISLAFMAYSFSSSMAFPIKHRCIHRINKEGVLLRLPGRQYPHSYNMGASKKSYKYLHANFKFRKKNFHPLHRGWHKL